VTREELSLAKEKEEDLMILSKVVQYGEGYISSW